MTLRKSIPTLLLTVVLLNLLTVGLSQAQIHVEIKSKAEAKPVSRNLYGVFTEHIGKNVYQGAWAQIIENPEMVSSTMYPDLPGDMSLSRLLPEAAKLFQLKDLQDDSENGIAAFWSASENVQGRILKESIHDFQRVVASDDAGSLRTGVFLPLQRTKTYQISIRGRADSSTQLEVVITDLDKNTLGSVPVNLSTEWETHEKQITVTSKNHSPGDGYLLELRWKSEQAVEISRILLFPGDHIKGWEPEVVKLMKDTQLPLLRFPGGNFVSGYDWRDGVGPLEERPVLPNPAWPIMEWNHVGTDEWVDFCRLTGATPMICLNAGNGTAENAADWIHYCNDPKDTKLGALRAKNGAPDQYQINIWEVGNELCGPWQIGYTDQLGYALRYKYFMNALKKADPDGTFIANGLIRVLEKNVAIDRGNNEGWNERLMELNGDQVTSISVHSLVGGYLRNPADAVGVWKGLVAYADYYPEYLNDLVAEPMKEAGVTPQVSITELMDWPRHSSLPNVMSISGAVWYASVLNQCLRNNEQFTVITRSALLNHGGGLRKERGIVYTDPVYWGHYMYSSHNNHIPMEVSYEGPTFASSGEYILQRENIPDVDIFALENDEGDSFTILLANRNTTSPYPVKIKLQDLPSTGQVDVMSISSTDLALKNTWDNPTAVYPETTKIKMKKGLIAYDLAPMSLTRITYNLKSE